MASADGAIRTRSPRRHHHNSSSSLSPSSMLQHFTTDISIKRKKKYSRIHSTDAASIPAAQRSSSSDNDDDGEDGAAASSVIELHSTVSSSPSSSTPLPATTSPPPAEETDDCLEAAAMIGLQWSLCRELAYYAVAVLTLSMSALLAFWFPVAAYQRRYRIVSSLSVADFVLVLTRNRQHELCVVEAVSESPASQRPSSLGRYLSPPPASLKQADRMIVFRHRRYVYSPATESFVRVTSPSSLPYSAVSSSVSHGLSSAAAASSLSLYGNNAIDIIVPSIPSLLVREVLHPFFVFQLYSVVLWCFEAYYIFAVCILVIAAVSVITTLLETRSRLQALAELARLDATVRVMRDGEWRPLPASAVVPGDLLQLTTGLVPCDVAVLSGSVVVNESMLTGESLPILKSAVDTTNKQAADSVPLSVPSHTLFSATSVLQLKPAPAQSHCLAMVTRTGWSTAKGSLMLSILYPAPSSFRFVEQSYRFVFTLFLLSLVGFAVSVWQLHRVGAGISLVIVRGLDLITIVVPPSLPLALSVGTNYALMSLRRQQVCCISPAKINVAGKLRLVAFDKTGTLTSDGITVKGVRPCRHAQFSSFIQQPVITTVSQQVEGQQGAEGEQQQQQQTYSNGALELEEEAKETEDDGVEEGMRKIGIMDSETANGDALTSSSLFSTSSTSSSAGGAVVQVDAMLHTAMSCCHSLAVLNGQLIGDPLEIEMFKSTAAAIIDDDKQTSAAALPSSASSSSSLPSIRIPSASSSSVVRVLHQYEFQSSLQRMTVVCCDESGQHFVFTKGAPEVVQSLCIASSVPADFTSAFASYARQGYRIIAIAYRPCEPIADMDRQRMRAELESSLSMLALLVLENRVKEETAPTLAELKAAKVRCVMVTGDYPATAVSVAKECGLVAEAVRVYQGRLADGEVEWTDSEDDDRRLDPLTLRPVPPAAPHAYELAITGDVFRHFASSSPAAFHRILLSTQVFARMTPEQKALVLTSLQSLRLYCGMVGDGSNDCSAMRSAHVGVSLSTTEASIAAPFTYLQPSIRCVPLLLREGRSALQTSFSLFRYIAMYSFIQFTAVLLCYFSASVFGNWQYLYQDMIVVFILTLSMGATQAADKLSIKRPSGDLLSVANSLCVAVHMALCIAFQIAVFFTLRSDPNYVNLSSTADDGPVTMETSSLYYFSNFQLLTMAVLFSLGRPWKKSIFSNRKFTIWCCVILVLNCLLLWTNVGVGGFFWRSEDVDLPGSWRGKLTALVIANTVTSCAWELLICPRCVQWMKSRRMRRGGGEIGTVWGQRKRISGKDAKEWHRLRGEFEQGWKLQE